MFDMSADVRGLFTWNTKLVFLYVTAEYKTELNVLNQIVIWDYIIEDVTNAQLTVGRSQTMLLPRHHNEYPLIDQVPHAPSSQLVSRTS
jgi:signal peptidase complex subunit 3